MEGIMEGYPYLVCEIDGVMAGYAYAHRYKERAAYQWDAELSVYLREDYARRGIGRAFYTALMEILKAQNVRNVYGIVTSPNPPSEALHLAWAFPSAFPKRPAISWGAGSTYPASSGRSGIPTARRNSCLRLTGCRGGASKRSCGRRKG